MLMLRQRFTVDRSGISKRSIALTKIQHIDNFYQETSINCIKLKACVKELTKACAIVYTGEVNKGVFT